MTPVVACRQRGCSGEGMRRLVLPPIMLLTLGCTGNADGPADIERPVDAVDAADQMADAKTETACLPVEWVAIPGGTFLMGATDLRSAAQPVHSVKLPSFKMARTEVTFCEYTACTEAGSCAAVPFQPAWGDGSQPVVGLKWAQSKDFCTWAGGRLCSESEWEYAARNGSAGNLYPWGDEPASCNLAVYGQGDQSCPEVTGTAAVCSKPIP